jgi:ferredoxin
LREAFELQAKDKATRRLKDSIQDTSPDQESVHMDHCQQSVSPCPVQGISSASMVVFLNK